VVVLRSRVMAAGILVALVSFTERARAVGIAPPDRPVGHRALRRSGAVGTSRTTMQTACRRTTKGGSIRIPRAGAMGLATRAESARPPPQSRRAMSPWQTAAGYRTAPDLVAVRRDGPPVVPAGRRSPTNRHSLPMLGGGRREIALHWNAICVKSLHAP
jgi:hypothetical protein